MSQHVRFYLLLVQVHDEEIQALSWVSCLRTTQPRLQPHHLPVCTLPRPTVRTHSHVLHAGWCLQHQLRRRVVLCVQAALVDTRHRDRRFLSLQLLHQGAQVDDGVRKLFQQGGGSAPRVGAAASSA